MTITVNLVASDGSTSTLSVPDPVVNSGATLESFYASTVVPANPVNKDSAVTLGTKFTVGVAGSVNAIRVYKGAVDTGDIAALMDLYGNVISQVNMTETAVGWVQATLPTPIALTPGTTYIAAYFTSGTYAADPNLFASQVTQNGITFLANGGVFNYGPSLSLPNQSYNASGYYVDVVFQPGEAGQAPPPPPTPGVIHFGMFGPSVTADYTNTEQQLGMATGSMWLSGTGLSYDSWANYTGSAYSAAQNAIQMGRRKIFINFPPIITGETLAHAAAGNFNQYYTEACGQFNNSNFDTVVFRCIWEFQGGWYPWGWTGGQDQSTYVQDFIGAFQQMVTAIRSNMGNVPNVQFCFSGAQDDQVQMPNWQACYPGDAYVDWVGADWYDGNPQDNTADTTTAEMARWSQDCAPGVSACLELCSAHKKGFAVPEWSVGLDGDDPYFIDQMRAAMQQFQNAGLKVFSGYWRQNYGGGTGSVGDYNQYPNSLARMIADFGGGQCT